MVAERRLVQRLGAVFAVVILVAIGLGLWQDLSTRGRLDKTQAELSTVRQKLAHSFNSFNSFNSVHHVDISSSNFERSASTVCFYRLSDRPCRLEPRV